MALHLRPRLLLLLLVFAFVPGLPAQCFGDDGFSIPGTCCAPVLTPNLPPFPALTLPSSGCCFLDCSVEATFPVTIALGAPVPLFCDVYVIPLAFGGGPAIQPGFLLGKYSRTWTEIDASGTVGHQVWRFIVNTDLVYLPPFSPPCPTPRCAASAGFPVHYVGALDYAEDCLNPGTWTAAINFTHFCGDLAHGPLSQRVTTFSHPERLFAFAGPTPFNWSAPGPPPQGVALGDAARSTQANLNTLTWNCLGEVPVNTGQSVLLGTTCACATTAGAPPRWNLMDVRLDYGCTAPGLNFAPIPWPPLFPTGFSMFPLGSYAHPPTTFQANKHVSVGMGVAAAPDPCGFGFPFHVVYGVHSQGGNPGVLFNSSVFSDSFLDLENCLVFVNNPPFMIIGYGSIFLSTMVWSANF